MGREHGDALDSGNHLHKQLQGFPDQVKIDGGYSCYVATRVRQASDDPGFYRIATYPHDNGNPGRRFHSGAYRRSSSRDDDIRLEPHQLGGKA